MTSWDGMVVCSLKGSGFGLKLRSLCGVVVEHVLSCMRPFSLGLLISWKYTSQVDSRLWINSQCTLCVLFDGTPVWLGGFLPLCRPRSLLGLQPWRKSVLATFTSTMARAESFFWTDWKENQIIYQTSQKLLYSVYNQLPQGEIIV